MELKTHTHTLIMVSLFIGEDLGTSPSTRRACLEGGPGRCPIPCPFQFSTTLLIILRFLYHVVIMK
jgi:hypothetical protein